jgi:hypothetical protein
LTAIPAILSSAALWDRAGRAISIQTKSVGSSQVQLLNGK